MSVTDPVAPLDAEAVCRTCDAAGLSFDSTAVLEPLEHPIGQVRALAALEFGAGMRRDGYNLFALGRPGTGRFGFVTDILRQRAAGEPAPSAWCYVNNFAEPDKPKALSLPGGRASELRQAMDVLIQELRATLPAAFDSDDYRARRQVVDEQFKRRHDEAFEALQEKAQGQGVAMIRTPLGMGLAPVRNGEVIPQEEFNRLPAEEQARLRTTLKEMQEELEQVVARLPQWQREHRAAVRKLNEEVSRFAVNQLIGEVRADFADLSAVAAYLDEVERDIVVYADDFLGEGAAAGAERPDPAPAADRDSEGGRYRRYRVNVMVDHPPGTGAPVVYEDHPTHQSLVGRIEHMARFGALLTDFNLVKPGALHRANGGYLVLDARRLLTNPFAWESLKRALRARQIRIESIEQLMALATTVSLEPEPLPLDVKIVLIGDRIVYYLLSELDPEFVELFKVAVDFEDDVPRDPESTQLFARMMGTLARQRGLRHLDRGAVSETIGQAARESGDAERLSTRIRFIGELLEEADYLAGRRGADLIGAEDVRAAVAARRARSDRIHLRMVEQIARGTILIDTRGAKIGQINALSVIGLGGFSFGRPTRVTARVRFGRGAVVDIEREVALGGPLHSKGVMILAGFLSGRYVTDRSLSLAASLVFEQSYGGVDGDSASSTELYALLSALAEAPIRQDLAVTGSVNQLGEVQVIGGVNEKIEGFFDVCAAAGMTGSQGVLIPFGNVRHLMLRPDVVEAVRAKTFFVYPIRTIDEGIALLTGEAAGERDEAGRYPEASINGRVEKRIAAFADLAARFGAAGKVDRYD